MRIYFWPFVVLLYFVFRFKRESNRTKKFFSAFSTRASSHTHTFADIYFYLSANCTWFAFPKQVYVVCVCVPVQEFPSSCAQMVDDEKVIVVVTAPPPLQLVTNFLVSAWNTRSTSDNNRSNGESTRGNRNGLHTNTRGALSNEQSHVRFNNKPWVICMPRSRHTGRQRCTMLRADRKSCKKSLGA